MLFANVCPLTVFAFVFGKQLKRSTINKVNYFLILLFSSFLSVLGNESQAQHNYKVLFLGNSYTYVNNLPQMVHDVALSAGDTLVFDSHTPGGYQLLSHSFDATSKNKIMAGGWDYIVLQGQSREPITAFNDFSSGYIALYNLIKQYNPCAVTIPYMTWGRKNGDASNCNDFPVMCTYQGMDTTIRNRYLDFAEFVNGEVSPVSVVWNYLRQNYPSIELYQTDESHPSVAGSYAAACCFYASLFKKDPTLITFNSGLSTSDATIIKNTVKTIVFNNLQTWNFKKLPMSNFSYQIGSGINEIIFGSSHPNLIRQTYFWNFGDGSTSSISHPTHSYSANGTYHVSLTTTNCDLQGMHTSTTDTIIQFCNHTPTVYTSDSLLCKQDTVWTEHADTYQWFVYGVPISETNQYIVDYAQHGISGFSVLSTLNGCSELSKIYTGTPHWSGYYFDLLGNPCEGDTVKFAVLHINGFLSGTENIVWYKNDTLLSSMTNDDTLFITTGGKYEVKVINPNANCPLDTTSYLIEYKCKGAVGVKEKNEELFWSVFPNPSSETIAIKFTKHAAQEQIQIYNAIGGLIKVIETSDEASINVADLPNGLYFIRLKNNKQSALKFIKL